MKNLFKALAEFQQEVPVIHKGTVGYGYSYANISQVFEVINPLLKKHGLGFTQLVGNSEIKTILFHVSSGEMIETITTIPSGIVLKGQNEYQTLGSAITYIRRYALSSMLGLVTDKDTDAASVPQKEEVKESKQQITSKQFESMLQAINNGKKLEVQKAMPKYEMTEQQKTVLETAIKNN